MVWNRATGTVSEVDVTSGPGRPNGTLAALAISDDGTRLAFKGEATNIVPEDTDYITDHFVADFTLGTISLAGLGPNGQRVTPHFDGNVTKMAWDTTTSYFPEDGDYYSDVYEKDLSSGVTTLLVDLGTSNTTGYGLDLNSIYYTGHVWRRGQATVDLTLGTLYRLSHDGRKVARWSATARRAPPYAR